MAFTERDIQRMIWLANHQRFMVLMPNYTPLGWWECDLFGVTKAGYFHEFEIKLTVADFRKDAKKKRSDSWQWIDNVKQTIAGTKKHEVIGQAIGPSRFWYVTPAGLVDGSEVPEWAGLQTFKPSHPGSTYSGYIRTVKQAPQIHKTKISDSIVNHSFSVCYHRYWNERNRHDQTKHNHEVAAQMQAMASP